MNLNTFTEMRRLEKRKVVLQQEMRRIDDDLAYIKRNQECVPIVVGS
jgi:hypothetical protein